MIYQNVLNYCEKNGISISAFEKKCGIGNGTVRLWENDNSKPMLATLEKIEKNTGIPIYEWLKERSD